MIVKYGNRQCNNYWILSGTVATIVLKGIVDYCQKRVDFKREIKRAIYTKKLDAAEDVMKALFQSYQSILLIITAIDNLLNKDMDRELFDRILEDSFKFIEEGESSLITSSAHLYFSLEDDNLWSLDDQKNFFEVCSNIKILGDEIQFYEKELEKIKGKDYEKEVSRIETEFREPLIREFRKLAELLHKNSKAISKRIQIIRTEFTN